MSLFIASSSDAARMCWSNPTFDSGGGEKYCNVVGARQKTVLKMAIGENEIALPVLLRLFKQNRRERGSGREGVFGFPNTARKD